MLVFLLNISSSWVLLNAVQQYFYDSICFLCNCLRLLDYRNHFNHSTRPMVRIPDFKTKGRGYVSR